MKRSVAVMVFHGGQILAIRRPGNDDELPGIWGLPAGTFQGRETTAELIERIGRDKLGVKLTPVRQVALGVQDRPQYRLVMELWEASMEGNPDYPEWQWASVNLLQAGAESGSLCCELAIKTKSRVSS